MTNTTQTFRFGGELWTLDQLRVMRELSRRNYEALVRRNAPASEIDEAEKARNIWLSRYFQAKAVASSSASTMPGAEDHENTDWEDNTL